MLSSSKIDSDGSSIAEEFTMPLWLQIAGAIASALLSYYTAYDDSRVQELIKDVAYDVKMVLQKLGEVSYQVDRLMIEIRKLPDEFRDILKEQELSEHNTAIQAAINRFRSIILSRQNNSFIESQITDTYNDLVKTTTQLQVLSETGALRLAPIAGILLPVAMLVEFALLYRLGSKARALRTQTVARYATWLDRMMAQDVSNNVAAAVVDSAQKLKDIDQALGSGILSAALQNPGTLQAVYCVEHQIGSDYAPDIFWGFPGSVREGNKTWAELYNETWLRLYGVAILESNYSFGVEYWQVGGTGRLEEEQYGRVALSDKWYGKKPAWTIPVHSYDSKDLKRFDGETTPQRISDIESSPLWRGLLLQIWPDAIRQLQNGNEARVYNKMASDVFASLQIARHLAADASSAGPRLELEDSTPS